MMKLITAPVARRVLAAAVAAVPAALIVAACSDSAVEPSGRRIGAPRHAPLPSGATIAILQGNTPADTPFVAVRGDAIQTFLQPRDVNGDSLQFPTDITWNSSDSSVATASVLSDPTDEYRAEVSVDAAASNTGTATITATTGDQGDTVSTRFRVIVVDTAAIRATGFANAAFATPDTVQVGQRVLIAAGAFGGAGTTLPLKRFVPVISADSSAALALTDTALTSAHSTANYTVAARFAPVRAGTYTIRIETDDNQFFQIPDPAKAAVTKQTVVVAGTPNPTLRFSTTTTDTLWTGDTLTVKAGTFNGSGGPKLAGFRIDSIATSSRTGLPLTKVAATTQDTTAGWTGVRRVTAAAPGSYTVTAFTAAGPANGLPAGQRRTATKTIVVRARPEPMVRFSDTSTVTIRVGDTVTVKAGAFRKDSSTVRLLAIRIDTMVIAAARGLNQARVNPTAQDSTAGWTGVRRLTAVSPGRYTVTAMTGTGPAFGNPANRNASARKTIIVLPAPAPVPPEVRINADSITLALYATRKLTATPTDTAGKRMSGTVTWITRDTTKATIDRAGTVKAVGAGTTWILARLVADSTVRDSAKVTVTAAPAASLVLKVDSSTTLLRGTQTVAIGSYLLVTVEAVDAKRAAVAITSAPTVVSSKTATATVVALGANGAPSVTAAPSGKYRFFIRGVAAGSITVKVTLGKATTTIGVRVPKP